MKVRKLLRKLDDFLDAKKRERRAQMDSMRKVLKTLKKKERDLRERLQGESDGATRAKLERKLGVIHAQRKKGVQALRELGRS
jgi:hypothetical protein